MKNFTRMKIENERQDRNPEPVGISIINSPNFKYTVQKLYKKISLSIDL